MVAELQELETAIEGRQFVAHANSILETEATTDKVIVHHLGRCSHHPRGHPPDPRPQLASLEVSSSAAGPLTSRLDQYYEDPALTKGKPNLVPFPPDFTAIPCKPLFYDLALYHVTMPDLDAKLKAGKAEEGAGAGLGSWLGGWGWGGKK